jgi:hypothetical protein
LDHDERIADVLMVENMSVECSLIWRVVEYLQELTTSEVEHELRVEREVLFQSDSARLASEYNTNMT